MTLPRNLPLFFVGFIVVCYCLYLAISLGSLAFQRNKDSKNQQQRAQTDNLQTPQNRGEFISQDQTLKFSYPQNWVLEPTSHNLPQVNFGEIAESYTLSDTKDQPQIAMEIIITKPDKTTSISQIFDCNSTQLNLCSQVTYNNHTFEQVNLEGQAPIPITTIYTKVKDTIYVFTIFKYLNHREVNQKQIDQLLNSITFQ